MIRWQEINNKIFEDIAYEYMICNYPNLEWKKTKLTNDGNKDGESIISNLPFNSTIRYWYEAKYSINTNKSIPKSHLDSTLVSSLLDGHVVVIAFITNAYISDDYKRRADIFARHRDNLKIYYINGEEIEDWLSENPNIEDKYFKTHSAEKHSIVDRIEEVCFLDKYNNANNLVVKLSTIELHREYLLYIRFYSSKKQQLKLSSDHSIEFLSEYSIRSASPTFLSVEKGNNALFIPIKVLLAQNEYALCIKGENSIRRHVVQGIKTLDLYKPKLVISSQIKLLNDINLFIKSNELQNLIFFIIGEAGSGKTFTLNALQNNVLNPFASVLLNFSGKIEHDIVICYKLFIYCQFGSLWELSLDNIEDLNFPSIVKDVLKEINVGISSRATQEKLIEFCSESSKEIIEQCFLQQQLYIDDVHKISSEVAELFLAILEWCGNQRLSKRIFLFSRPLDINHKHLDKFLKMNASYIKELEEPSLNDVKCSIELNLGNIPSLAFMIQNFYYAFNALFLYDFLCILKENINHLKKLDVIDISVEVSNILDSLNCSKKSKVKRKILKTLHKNILFNFVYKLENGVSINALIDFFDETIYDEISSLCQKRIIKEKSGKLYPFHDILLEDFRENENDSYIKKLGEFVLFCIEKKYFSQSEGYYHLVALGGRFFWKYKSVAEKFREELHEYANYYAAEKIAKKIQEENHKNLCDYDYSDMRNLFVLGNCYKYTKSYEASNEVFERIKKIYGFSTCIAQNDILLETYSEIINNNLWMLYIHKADSDLKKMSQMWDPDEDFQKKSKTYKYGYLNYYNRRMFCDFMLGVGSEEGYVIALSKAKELNLKEYEGFAHMDYAKSIYNIDIAKAEILLENAKEIFKEKNETRRLLDALSELAFIKALQCKSYATGKLEEIYYIMKEKKYVQSYTKTYLKILVIMLLSNRYTSDELVKKVNSILFKNTAIASGKRHQALIYHILAAIYYKSGDLKQSAENSKKCLNLFSELGNTYKEIHHHNIKVQKKNQIILGYEKNNNSLENDFILDTRIW